MRFETPGVFLFIFLIPLLHRWWVKKGKTVSVVFPVKLVGGVRDSDPKKYLRWIRYCSVALLIVSLARPQLSSHEVERKVSGVEIVLTLDVSASMNIEDLAEVSRLEVAKETLKQFVQGRSSDRIGFVIFSGEALTLAPPTLDYGLVLQAISDTQTGMLRDGTAIGDGLSMAVGRLRNSEAKSKVIVLLTDGENNIGKVDPTTAGELAAGYGIRVYTIAIGKEGRVKLPMKAQTPLGNVVTSYQWYDNALNTDLLQKISVSTQAKSYRVTDANTLSEVFREIDQLTKSEIKTQEKVKYDEKFAVPLLWALALLVLEWMLRITLWRTVP